MVFVFHMKAVMTGILRSYRRVGVCAICAPLGVPHVYVARMEMAALQDAE